MAERRIQAGWGGGPMAERRIQAGWEGGLRQNDGPRVGRGPHSRAKDPGWASRGPVAATDPGQGPHSRGTGVARAARHTHGGASVLRPQTRLGHTRTSHGERGLGAGSADGDLQLTARAGRGPAQSQPVLVAHARHAAAPLRSGSTGRARRGADTSHSDRAPAGASASTFRSTRSSLAARPQRPAWPRQLPVAPSPTNGASPLPPRASPTLLPRPPTPHPPPAGARCSGRQRRRRCRRPRPRAPPGG